MQERSKEPTENRFYRRFTGIACGSVTWDRTRKNGLKVETKSDVSGAIAVLISHGNAWNARLPLVVAGITLCCWHQEILCADPW